MGVPQAPFYLEHETNETGLELSFRPDLSLLGSLKFDSFALAGWLPSVGVRFGSFEYRPGAADRSAVLYFKELCSHFEASSI